MKICSVDGCNSPAKSKGYCSKHYHQIVRYGYIKDVTQKDMNDILIFEDYAEIVLRDKNCEECGRAIIDLDKVDMVKAHKWGLKTHGYAATTINGKNVYLHRFITNAQDGDITDHINRNKLDDRLCNLRFVTRSQNNTNRSAFKPNNSTGIIGVSYDKKSDKYEAYINVDKKKKHLGFFPTVNEALEVRMRYEMEYYEVRRG